MAREKTNKRSMHHHLGASFQPVLSGLVTLGAAGCATPATPPESTPVYAEEVAPGAEPIAVEKSSVDDPEVETVAGSNSEEAAEPASEDENAKDADEPDPTGEPAAPADTEKSAAESAGEAPEKGPEAAPAKAAPAKPSSTKPSSTKPSPTKPKAKKASGAEGGCGPGTCG